MPRLYVDFAVFGAKLSETPFSSPYGRNPQDCSLVYVIHAEVAETLFAPLLPLTTASQQQAPALEATHDPTQGDALRPCGMALYLSVPADKNPFENEPRAQQAARKPCPVPTRTKEPALKQSQVLDPPSKVNRDRAAAERAAQAVLSAGKAEFEKGLCTKAIAVYQAGLALLDGWENTTAWADLQIQLGIAKFQAGKEAQDPDEKRSLWSGARQSFDAAQLVYQHKVTPDSVVKTNEERRLQKVWTDLAERRDAVERALGGAYRPAFYIPPAAVDEPAEKSDGFHWSTLEQAVATLQQERRAVKAAEKKLVDSLIAGDSSNATAMLMSPNARMHNSGPNRALNIAAERLATVLADSAVELAIVERGKPQKRRAQTVLAAYQALATTDSAIEALKWANSLLAQPNSQLHRVLATVLPDVKTTLETTIIQPALPAIEAAYDEGSKSRYVDPEHQRDKIFANVVISTLRASMLIRDLPNQRKAMRDPGDASDRGTNYWGRASWPIKGNWTWGNVMTLEQGAEQIASGEIWNGSRYVLPAAGSLITFTNAWSKSFPTIDPGSGFRNWEFTGLRNLVVGKTPDKAGTLLNDIFNTQTKFIRPFTQPLASGIKSASDQIVHGREELFLKRIEKIESLLKQIAERMNSNPVVSKFQSAFVAAEPWIVGLVVDAIAFYEHFVNREFSFANATAALGDALGFFANIALSIANHGASAALKARMLVISTVISWIVQGLQLGGELIENLWIQTKEQSERIFPAHPFHGGLILYGAERNSIVLDDSRTSLVTGPLAIKDSVSDLLYQLVAHMSQLVTDMLSDPQDVARKP